MDMSRYIICPEWPAKAEPLSPFLIDEENWYISDDLDLDDGDYYFINFTITA